MNTNKKSKTQTVKLLFQTYYYYYKNLIKKRFQNSIKKSVCHKKTVPKQHETDQFSLKFTVYPKQILR